MNWKQIAKRLFAKNRTLFHKNGMLKAALEGNDELVRMHYEKGVAPLDIQIRSHGIQIFAAACRDFLKDAPNYVEMQFEDSKGGLTVTSQKREGLTPHQLRQKAEEDLRKHRADVVQAAGELRLPIPEPGTDMSKLMIANRLLINEKNDLLSRAVDAERERDKAREMAMQSAKTSAAYQNERDDALVLVEDLLAACVDIPLPKELEARLKAAVPERWNR